MAEGIVAGHSLFVASQDTKPMFLVSELPAVIPDNLRGSNDVGTDEQMKIAWRYQHMKVIDSSPTGSQKFGHYYDLTKRIDKETVERADVTYWGGEDKKWDVQGFENTAYVDLLKKIERTLTNGEFMVEQSTKKRNILRIAIHSLGSRMWLCDTQKKTNEDFLKFLYILRGLLRGSYAVVALTVPVHYFDNSVSYFLVLRLTLFLLYILSLI